MKCLKCGEEKDNEEFYHYTTYNYNKEHTCKKCTLEQDKKYRENNKERTKYKNKKAQKKWQSKNRELNKQKCKEYKKNNKEKVQEYRKNYYNQNHAAGLGLKSCGEKHKNSKLTESQIKEIREDNRKTPQRVFAEKFGVARSLISMIQNNKIWKQI
jgi:tRNA nucleotidyltransferase/poly(A) polymerase